MSAAHTSLDAAIYEVERVGVFLKKNASRQVNNRAHLSLIKATCLTWFNNHRSPIAAIVGEASLSDVDQSFRELLSATDRATTLAKYSAILKQLRSELSKIRGLTVAPKPVAASSTTDAPPNFATLVSDQAMQSILVRRWQECAICVNACAPLAATVMMGGLLESLLLARVLKEPNRAVIFALASAPKDPKSSKPQPLQDWTLRHYIDAAREMKWISESAKDVGAVLRDYRNYIHPNKQLSHGMNVEVGDAKMFWEISKAIARELL